jgi:hypothetical protein
MATSCAWLLGLPPVARGQAAAGDAPGLGDAVGTIVAVALARGVALGDAEGDGVGASDREADGIGVAVDAGRVSGSGPHELMATMPRARASAP